MRFDYQKEKDLIANGYPNAKILPWYVRLWHCKINRDFLCRCETTWSSDDQPLPETYKACWLTLFYKGKEYFVGWGR